MAGGPRQYDVVAMGESLVQLSPLESGPISQVGMFDKHAAGSESNVLIGMSRLGLKTALITKLGSDGLSRFILNTLRGEGVDTRWVTQVPDRNCGVYFSQRDYPVPGKSDVIYFRKGSAASTISVADVPVDAVSSAKVVHLSGITPALSDSCRKASVHLARLAKKHGAMFSFDPNYRKKLWPKAEAAKVFRELAKLADILFVDPDEASMILGKEQRGTPEAIQKALAKLGPSIVVLKLGASGGVMALKDGSVSRVQSFKVPVVDVIGAGDATASGFLSGMIRSKDVETCLRWGAASSALVVMRRGDFENLPTPLELDAFLESQKSGGELDLR